MPQTNWSKRKIRRLTYVLWDITHKYADLASHVVTLCAANTKHLMRQIPGCQRHLLHIASYRQVSLFQLYRQCMTVGSRKLQLLWAEDSVTAPTATAVPAHHLFSAPWLHVASELTTDSRIQQSPLYGYPATQSREVEAVLLWKGMRWLLTLFILTRGKMPFTPDNCDRILFFGLYHYLELWRMIDRLSEREIWSKLICSEDKRNLSSASPKEAKLSLLSLHRSQIIAVT